MASTLELVCTEGRIELIPYDLDMLARDQNSRDSRTDNSLKKGYNGMPWFKD